MPRRCWRRVHVSGVKSIVPLLDIETRGKTFRARRDMVESDRSSLEVHRPFQDPETIAWSAK